MVERRELLRESIAKLLSLGVSDREILTNLRDVGLTDSEARSLLEETKKGKSVQRRVGNSSESRDFSKEDDLSSAISEAKQELGETPKELSVAEAEKEPAVSFGSFGSSKPALDASSAKGNSFGGEGKTDVLELWEKGIMATVNSKLSEMESLKADIEGVIGKKIEKGLAKEIAKIDAVFEGQRTLGAQRINEALEKKSGEVADLIDQKILQLNKSNDLGKEWFSKLDSQRKESEKILLEMNSRLEEISKLKSRIGQDIDFEFEKYKQKVEKFLSESEDKRKETVQRINRSLELEAKIVEGLMNDAKQKIDSLALKKSLELEQSLIARFDAQKAELDKKIKELEDVKQKVDSFIAKKSSAIEKDLSVRFDAQKAEMDMKINKLEELEGKIDIETIRTTMEELGTFRKQFAAQIKRNVDSFNSAKKELTELISQRELLIDKQLDILRLKIKELDLFEEEFASKVGMHIDKVVEAKKGGKTEKSGKRI